jgi:hypothetical protein
MMNRCAMLIAFLMVVPLFVGCAEESLDVPMGGELLEGDRIQYTPDPDHPLTRDADVAAVADRESPAANVAAVESMDAEPPPPSTVRSIFNALKNGASKALDEPNAEIE